jgi:arylsulfatase
MLTNAELSDPTPPAKPWAGLSDAERKAFAVRMEIHAAMVDRMDREIGRIIEQLRAAGTLDNTVVLFLSDNGASAESLVRGDGNQPGASPGSAQSYLCLEAQGASLANTPLRYSKTFVHEGGISTPLIVRWPVGIKGKGELREQPVHVVDIAPTFLRLAGVPWPKKVGEQNVPAPDGVDLTWVIRDNRPLASRALWWAHEGNRAFRLGDWKWVALKGKGAELYYLRGDRTEVRDLAAANPERLGEMEAQWNRMSAKMREDAQEAALASQSQADAR